MYLCSRTGAPGLWLRVVARGAFLVDGPEIGPIRAVEPEKLRLACVVLVGEKRVAGIGVPGPHEAMLGL